MRLSEVLRDKPERVVSLPPHASTVQAARLMRIEGVGAILIRNSHGRFLGVLSERDLAVAVSEFGAGLLDMQVSELMSVDVPAARPTDSVRDVMRLMTERRARHLPVVDGERLVGVVSIGDLLKSRLAEKIQENAVLQDLARVRLPA